MEKVISLTEERYKEWNEFVESSPQGTVFSTTKWLKLLDNVNKIWYIYYGGTVCHIWVRL